MEEGMEDGDEEGGSPFFGLCCVGFESFGKEGGSGLAAFCQLNADLGEGAEVGEEGKEGIRFVNGVGRGTEAKEEGFGGLVEGGGGSMAGNGCNVGVGDLASCADVGDELGKFLLEEPGVASYTVEERCCGIGIEVHALLFGCIDEMGHETTFAIPGFFMGEVECVDSGKRDLLTEEEDGCVGFDKGFVEALGIIDNDPFPCAEEGRIFEEGWEIAGLAIETLAGGDVEEALGDPAPLSGMFGEKR